MVCRNNETKSDLVTENEDDSKHIVEKGDSLSYFLLAFMQAQRQLDLLNVRGKKKCKATCEKNEKEKKNLKANTHLVLVILSLLRQKKK